MKPFQHFVLGFALILLPFSSYAAPTTPNGLAERNIGHVLNPLAHSSIIQWTSDNGRVNHLRMYYITQDNKVIEGSRSSTATQWVYNALPGITAFHKSPIVAAVHQRSKVSAGDVEIRLFYEEVHVSARYEVPGSDSDYEKHRMRSAFYKPETGWTVDENFYDNIGYVAQPGSAISWVDKAGKLQWRLYFISQAPGDQFNPFALARMILTREKEQIWESVSKNSIYEGCIDENGQWTLCNGHEPLAVATQSTRDLGSVAAVSWDGGARVSVFWWDTEGHAIYNGRIRETRWRDGEGWTHMPKPNDSWGGDRKMSTEGRLAAVTWVDGSGVDQIRLYATTRFSGATTPESWIYEYQADGRGWVNGRSDKFDWTERKSGWLRPISAVAWTGPNSRDDVHIRVINPGCAASKCLKYENPSIGLFESVYDTGLGWRDGGRISA